MFCGRRCTTAPTWANARPVIVFDVLNGLLRHVYGEDHVDLRAQLPRMWIDKINGCGRRKGAVNRAISPLKRRSGFWDEYGRRCAR